MTHAPGPTTADYLDALSTIDQSIRSLMNSATQLQKTSTLAAPDPGLAPDSVPALASLPSPLSPTLARSPMLPDSAAAGNGGCDGNDDDDYDDYDDAMAAFLCSKLPHYEGLAGVDYGDLGAALAGDSPVGAGSDCEDAVPDSAWDSSIDSVRGRRKQEGDGSDEYELDARRLAAYEGWIELDALVDAAQTALAHAASPDNEASDKEQAAARSPLAARLRIGRRSETDHMLVYALEAEKPTQTHTQVLVQVPKPTVPAHVFASEIATLEFLARSGCRLPVPRVVAHELSAANAAGVPYAVVTQPCGAPLGALWFALGAGQKRRVLAQIADVVVQLSRLRLPRIGSLVPAQGSGSEAAVVGPLLCARDAERGYEEETSVSAVGGPFESTLEYLDALVRASGAALDRMGATAAADEVSRIEVSAYRANAHRFVERKYNGGPFVLMPESLDLHHFVVDPESLRLAAVVDWTYACVRPLQSLAQPPPFVFDDAPRWEPRDLESRVAHRRNLIRERQWFMAAITAGAGADAGVDAGELQRLVRYGYWRYKFEHEAAQNIRYSNPWSFRALWEHLHPHDEFALWMCRGLAQLDDKTP
ncbi:hypothetical protein H4217_002598 [Coemansia sp. RSA 1939]|nr:hypothetical protein H4217_002598 [Coemansia sp. RSA 1939]KAJ2613905.1 hypothetical protein EV177_002308 [Coemansia sp. RSA 1804]KAJ2693179.1 hypothetical protein GGH99_001290 [Coemansia sp. RSA 1285]